jgi:hypothetical protein
MKNKIAIHESAISDKVIKFLDLEKFNLSVQKAYNNGLIIAFYYKNNKINYLDIWGDENLTSFNLS